MLNPRRFAYLQGLSSIQPSLGKTGCSRVPSGEVPRRPAPEGRNRAPGPPVFPPKHEALHPDLDVFSCMVKSGFSRHVCVV